MPEVRKLAEGVYAFLQPPLICHSSAGVIVGDRDVLVVDSLTNAAMAQSLRTEIRGVTDKPIRFLINTHTHSDHVYTNHLFPEATVISTHRARDETKANRRLMILASSCEFTGGRPESADPASRNHMTVLQGIATEAKRRLGRKGPS
jgi:glyoxylase-like metal-dependent hydrolase (beta-lactamase superfamily II)